MTEIQIYNDGNRVAKTSKAFDIKITHELMRMYTLSFGVLATDNSLKYIYPASTGTAVNVICDGQGYDVTGFDATTGDDNSMIVNAEHVAYRLLNYTLSENYSFVGTVAEIAADILDKAVDGDGNKASTEFSVGTTPDLGSISFSLENTQEVTAKYAIMALQTFGAECDYDNFTINFAEHINSGNTETFNFGVNLGRLRRTWTADNGTTYDVDIADLQYVSGHSGDVFDIGDTCTISDSFIGDTITSRIITYVRYPDEPNRNSITLGVFKSDVSSDTVSMRVDIDNSVQQGAEYNKVKITAAEGYTAEATIGGKAVKVVMNATDGIKITVDGIKTFGVTSDGRTFTQSVGNREGKDAVYGEIGTVGGTHGLRLMKTGEDTGWYGVYELGDSVGFLILTHDKEILYATSTDTIVYGGGQGILYGLNTYTQLAYHVPNSTHYTEVLCNADGVDFKKDGVSIGLTGGHNVSSPDGNKTLTFVNGLLTSVDYL